jgi:hypothetical protein
LEPWKGVEPRPETGPQPRADESVADKSEERKAEALEEVSRLMGEIARTIENAVKPSNGKESFSMCLRSGQLKIAERYPFLDPFGSEFEYHAGEIAFVGLVEPARFISALTEALAFAVSSLTLSAGQPARLHSRIENDLRLLIEKRRSEFEPYGLESAVEAIIRGGPERERPATTQN